MRARTGRQAQPSAQLELFRRGRSSATTGPKREVRPAVANDNEPFAFEPVGLTVEDLIARCGPPDDGRQGDRG